MSRSSRHRISMSVDMELLESRRLLVAFGLPWPDARELSISFPSDEVSIGRYQNDINETLDQVAGRQQWQELLLRAYQSWAVHVDINVGLRNDHDLGFGVAGEIVGDSRFGEFRIGAIPQEGLLASALPFQVLAGTYSGDLVLDSNQQFTFDDWADGEGPDPASLGELDRDLYSVLLHEVGNTLGIPDSLSPTAVMFGQYTTPKGVLTAEDIAELQTLYGERTDPYESSENDSIALATHIPHPMGFDISADVIRLRGSTKNGADVDVYRFEPEAGQDSVTVRLHAKELSLLLSRVEVVDVDGQVLSSATAESVFDNDVEVAVDQLSEYAELFIRVEASDSQGVYSAGDYELAIDYRDSATQAADYQAAAYDAGVETLFNDFGFVDDELGVNDTLASAGLLDATTYDASRYEAEASIAVAGDVDWYAVTAPAEASTRLMVTVSAVGADAAEMRVNIIGANGENVGATGRLHKDGTWELRVEQPVPDAQYLLRISVDPDSSVSVGNYVATAHFEQPSDQMNSLASGEATDDVDEFIKWTATETRLYRFDFSVDGAQAGDGIQLAVYDAHTKELRMLVQSKVGETRSVLSWLQQGDYILRFSLVSENASAAGNVSYSLLAEGLSDDQAEDEGTDDPDSYAYDYEYVNSEGTYGDYFAEIYYDFEAYYEAYFYAGEEEESQS